MSLDNTVYPKGTKWEATWATGSEMAIPRQTTIYEATTEVDAREQWYARHGGTSAVLYGTRLFSKPVVDVTVPNAVLDAPPAGNPARVADYDAPIGKAFVIAQYARGALRNDARLPDAQLGVLDLHDTYVSFSVTAGDKSEYVVTVLRTKAAPTALPTEVGALITWTEGNDFTHIARRNGAGRWDVIAPMRGKWADARQDQLVEHLADANWQELVVKP